MFHDTHIHNSRAHAPIALPAIANLLLRLGRLLLQFGRLPLQLFLGQQRLALLALLALARAAVARDVFAAAQVKPEFAAEGGGPIDEKGDEAEEDDQDGAREDGDDVPIQPKDLLQSRAATSRGGACADGVRAMGVRAGRARYCRAACLKHKRAGERSKEDVERVEPATHPPRPGARHGARSHGGDCVHPGRRPDGREGRWARV
mmetsp:Transcript_4208/g.11142  ORF Transcript_4208/g.11142 Transcript_4208/m.11142 type:complete len:204 (+) Transcript_4208:225-836(+)